MQLVWDMSSLTENSGRSRVFENKKGDNKSAILSFRSGVLFISLFKIAAKGMEFKTCP
jgi:D-Tyr-tRNAtyr deacylase